jgi:thiol-disulfide isomerase/thioredoxin
LVYKILPSAIAFVFFFLSLVGCAAPESIQADVPTAGTVSFSSPMVSVETATLAPTKEIAPTASVDYTWTDESPAPDQFSVIVIEAGSAKVKDILQAEAQKAAALGRQPYIEFYADWCPPCNAIKKNLSDPLMVEAFAGTYIIKLDTDVWGDKLSGLGIYVPGIPAFYELDENGKPTGRMITGAAWGEDIPANIAPPMKEFFEGN